MKRPVLTAAAAFSALLATSASAQTLRDYATIYGARSSSASVDLQTQTDTTTTTVGTGPATRYAKPQPGSEARPAQSEREFGFRDYGRVSGGFPEYGSSEFPAGQRPPAQAPGEGQQPEGEQQAENGEQGEVQAEGQEGTEEFAVSEGFFFDNFTSGTGFGVYGGEAVSSGSGSPLILPSAGNRAQELGFQAGPGTGAGGGGAPTGPTDPTDGGGV